MWQTHGEDNMGALAILHEANHEWTNVIRLREITRDIYGEYVNAKRHRANGHRVPPVDQRVDLEYDDYDADPPYDTFQQILRAGCRECLHFLYRKNLIGLHGFDNEGMSYVWLATRECWGNNPDLLLYIVQRLPWDHLVGSSAVFVRDPDHTPRIPGILAVVAKYERAAREWERRVRAILRQPLEIPSDWKSLWEAAESCDVAVWADKAFCDRLLNLGINAYKAYVQNPTTGFVRNMWTHLIERKFSVGAHSIVFYLFTNRIHIHMKISRLTNYECLPDIDRILAPPWYHAIARGNAYIAHYFSARVEPAANAVQQCTVFDDNDESYIVSIGHAAAYQLNLHGLQMLRRWVQAACNYITLHEDDHDMPCWILLAICTAAQEGRRKRLAEAAERITLTPQLKRQIQKERAQGIKDMMEFARRMIRCVLDESIRIIDTTADDRPHRTLFDTAAYQAWLVDFHRDHERDLGGIKAVVPQLYLREPRKATRNAPPLDLMDTSW
ncbi:hypothetical protein N7509_009145 [Penicillium cosmopolitanum]|uniref:Uncharacterized protein n=1 Tax=Penicillium cosmopolitanum TaxID=1131564 RepID=A0A9W9VP05_9EURO|nr:uncharacterized protein N7509_009145 [Penicillium cosmopolitanum]KAJ5386604.1 hypothetical protein N7509_009145 [Penicillium cosmopolitanum]